MQTLSKRDAKLDSVQSACPFQKDNSQKVLLLVVPDLKTGKID